MPARFFQPSFSQQQVPSYAPLPLDTVRYGVERAMEGRQMADQSLDLFTAQHQDTVASLTPQNRAQAEEILQQSSEFIDHLADPESGVRYQDMVPLIRRQARQAQQQIQPYVEDSASIRAFQDRVQSQYDSGDITGNYYSFLQNRLADYGGLEFDEEGRPRGFQAPPIVRKIDINKRISDFMKHIESGNEQVLIAEYPGNEAFVREITQRYHTGEDRQALQSIIASNLLQDPEVEQFLQAEHFALNDTRRRQGQEEMPYGDFVAGFVDPYVHARSMPTQQQRLRSNPAFSAQDFSSSILTPEAMIGTRESTISTPGEYMQQLNELGEMYEGTIERAGNELRNIGLEARFDEEQGKFIVDNPFIDGVDRSFEITALNSEIEMSRNNLTRMEQYDADIRRQAEQEMNMTFDDNERRYQEVIDDAFNRWNASGARFERHGVTRSETLKAQGKDPWEEFQKDRSYQQAMERVSPLYKRYVELFHENAQGGHRRVHLASLGKAGDDYMKNHLRRSASVIMDGKTRQVLYEQGRGDSELDFDVRDAEYAGVFPDEGGELMAAYQVFDEDGMNPRLILTPAPPGAFDHMLQAGNYSGADHYVLSQLQGLSSEPGAPNQTFLPIISEVGEEIGDAGIEVRMLPRSQQDPSRGRQYQVIAVSPDGRRAQYFVGSGNDVARLYRNLHENITRK